MSEWADFAAELAGAVTEQDVLAVLGEMIGPLAGAQLVNIALLDPDGHTMRLVEARGMRAEVASQLATYDLRILRPSTEALASGEVVLLRTPDDLDRRFPEVAGTPLDQTSLAVAPLGPRDRPLGVLSLGWVREQTFDPDQVQGIRQLATICGAAMERAQAHHRESEARLDAQRTAQRLADLYALTTRLAAATSATEVATTLIEVCLPMLSASAATITIYDGLRRPRLLAATGIPGVEDILFGGSDPEDLPGAEAYAQLSAVRQMVRDRRPVLVTSAADRRLRYPDLVADEGVQEAWANLPLVVGDRLVGIVAFGWDDPRWFDAEETSFLSSVAAHTAIALDRALSLQAAESAVARMRTLQEVTAGLATAATIEEIAEVLFERGVRMVATFGVVAVLDREARVWRRFSSQNLPPGDRRGVGRHPGGPVRPHPDHHGGPGGTDAGVREPGGDGGPAPAGGPVLRLDRQPEHPVRADPDRRALHRCPGLRLRAARTGQSGPQGAGPDPGLARRAGPGTSRAVRGGVPRGPPTPGGPAAGSAG